MNYRSLRIHDNVDYLLNVRAIDLAVVVHVGLLGSRAATDLNLHCGNIGVLAVILGRAGEGPIRQGTCRSEYISRYTSRPACQPRRHRSRRRLFPIAAVGQLPASGCRKARSRP